MGLLARTQTLGTLTHHLGALVVIGASIWAALEAWSSEMELQVDEP